VDKPSSKQQLSKMMIITFVVLKIWSHTLALLGFIAGWQAGRENSAK